MKYSEEAAFGGVVLGGLLGGRRLNNAPHGIRGDPVIAVIDDFRL